ncbi:MAG: GNAT family N-acetyltransferase [Clostridiales bacterium]|nr:GNAT family N-acetyltransferase [Clostridiales bacterium]
MKIVYASEQDSQFIFDNDKHLPGDFVLSKISDREIIIAKDNDVNVGWLRYGYFWDNIPFMNMLFVLDGHRNRGIGCYVAHTHSYL